MIRQILLIDTKFMSLDYRSRNTDKKHGTHVAGIAGGGKKEHNGKNISGVAPNVDLILFNRGTYTAIENGLEVILYRKYGFSSYNF